MPDSLPGREPDWFERFGIRHLALIPDGNRRWARARGVPDEAGHDRGLLEVLPALIDQLFGSGLYTLSVWGFSTENWRRSRAEIAHLMGIFETLATRVLPAIAARHAARVHHLGRSDRLPARVSAPLARLAAESAGRQGRVLNLALDYGGEDELQRAAERMLAAARAGELGSRRVGDFLDTSGQPYPQPELVIRSAGEQRLSGFLPLQTAYSELFFAPQPFPDFELARVLALAAQFRARARHFGS